MNQHHPHGHNPHHDAPRKAIHKDWRLWAVVGVMLLAMLIYVLSFDEALGPSTNSTGQPLPAAEMPADAPVDAAP
jgi:hypothetical protein